MALRREQVCVTTDSGASVVKAVFSTTEPECHALAIVCTLLLVSFIYSIKKNKACSLEKKNGKCPSLCLH